MTSTAIVIPSMTMVHAAFAKSLAMLTVETGGPLAVISVTGSQCAKARNHGVKEALKYGVDEVLFLDSDMSFPPDTLLRLRAAGKPIVGCNYVRRTPGSHLPLAVPKMDDQRAPTYADATRALAGGGVVEVAKLPTGVLLVDAKVFDAVPRPWFWYPVLGDDIVTEDYAFCDAARAAGFSVWVDCDLSPQVIHWGEIGLVLAAAGDYRMVEGQY